MRLALEEATAGDPREQETRRDRGWKLVLLFAENFVAPGIRWKWRQSLPAEVTDHVPAVGFELNPDFAGICGRQGAEPQQALQGWRQSIRAHS